MAISGISGQKVAQRVDGSALYGCAARLLPLYRSPALMWGDIWNQPIQTGAALEWTTLAAIATIARERGWLVSTPLVDGGENADLFRLRNEVPRAHGAQAGHSAAISHEIVLARRFLAAFTPKLVMRRQEDEVSVFREGCPYQVQLPSNVIERPDMLFVEGAPVTGYPRLTDDGTALEFAFGRAHASVAGAVRVRNAPFVSYVKAVSAAGVLRNRGIIECSVNKTPNVASRQLALYEQLFATQTEVPIVLVTGNDLGKLGYPSVQLPLTQVDPDALYESFRKMAERVLTEFGLF